MGNSTKDEYGGDYLLKQVFLNYPHLNISIYILFF